MKATNILLAGILLCVATPYVLIGLGQWAQEQERQAALELSRAKYAAQEERRASPKCRAFDAARTKAIEAERAAKKANIAHKPPSWETYSNASFMNPEGEKARVRVDKYREASTHLGKVWSEAKRKADLAHEQWSQCVHGYITFRSVEL